MFSPVVRAAAISQSGKIEGIVSSADDNTKIKNAMIFVTKPITGQTKVDTIASAKTTTTGYYAIIGVLPGTYSMTCSADGYKDLTVPAVNVVKSSITTQNFSLTKK